MPACKPHLAVINGAFVEIPWPRIGPNITPVERARIRYGRPFAHQAGTEHVHTAGAAYWTPERINALAIDNAKRRNSK